MKLCLSLIIVLCFTAFSETTDQTNWSGGSGTTGPVTDWKDKYDISNNIYDQGGTLKLHKNYLSNTIISDFFGAYSIFAADINGDGKTDILGAAYNGKEMAWWENTDGSGSTWVKHTINRKFDGACSIYSTDIDADGDMDVLGASRLGDEIIWWENKDGSGTSWGKHIVSDSFQAASQVYAADIDNDGDVDILGSAYVGDAIAWWENTNGTGTAWTKHTVTDSFDAAHSVHASDINNDGNIDILGAACKDNEITWWENTNGDGTAWTEHTVDNSANGAISVYSIDIDGDSDIDIVGAAFDDDEFAWWENTDGTGTAWTKHSIGKNLDGARVVYATDMDGDNDIDVLGAVHRGAGHVMWFENTDGSGSTWVEHYIDDKFLAAISIYAADINGDGNTDVITCCNVFGKIVWWDLSTYENNGTLSSSILDAGSVSQWDTFSSSISSPGGSSYGFQFRSSDDADNMGNWSDTLFSNSTALSGILSDTTRFLQYRVLLASNDLQTETPILDDVVFTYSTYLGTASDTKNTWSFASVVNPSYNHYTTILTVPEAATVSFMMFDISGRIITESLQEFGAGVHSVNFTGLSRGTYFCRVKSDDFSAAEKVIILN